MNISEADLAYPPPYTGKPYPPILVTLGVLAFCLPSMFALLWLATFIPWQAFKAEYACGAALFGIPLALVVAVGRAEL